MKKLCFVVPVILMLSGCCGESCCGTAQAVDKPAVETISQKSQAKAEIVEVKETQKAEANEVTAKKTNESTRLRQEASTRQAGPTVLLFGETAKYPDNRLSDFMYFVPLISPVTVTAEQSSDNTQGGHLLSFESSQKGNKFYVSCEFRMKGQGWYQNNFDNDAMIAWNTQKESKKVLKNILDYIKFDGEGYGRIEAGGTITSAGPIADYVNVYFNARGTESPVSVGLFDIDLTKKEGGHFIPYNRKVARVNELLFERSKTAPLMGIKIAAVGKNEESLGTWAHIVGSIGNWFINPIEVDKLGNDTMLNFGAGLYEKNSKFTFPIAKNLKVEGAAYSQLEMQ